MCVLDGVVMFFVTGVRLESIQSYIEATTIQAPVVEDDRKVTL